MPSTFFGYVCTSDKDSLKNKDTNQLIKTTNQKVTNHQNVATNVNTFMMAMVNIIPIFITETQNDIMSMVKPSTALSFSTAKGLTGSI